jgi:hypothetical protein
MMDYTSQEKARLNLVKHLLDMVKANEWQTRHAAENTYCPYCNNDSDAWEDQKEHHDGCQFVMVVNAVHKLYPELPTEDDDNRPNVFKVTLGESVEYVQAWDLTEDAWGLLFWSRPHYLVKSFPSSTKWEQVW